MNDSSILDVRAPREVRTVMYLSDTLYADVRACLGLAAAAPPPLPKAPADGAPAEDSRTASRAGVRVDLDLPVEVEPHGVCNPRRRRVRLKDISVSGASWVDDFTLAVNDRLIIHLPRKSLGGRTVPVVCEVRNCRVVDGHFRVGVEFAMGDTTHTEFAVSAHGLYQRHDDPRVTQSADGCGRTAPRSQVRCRAQLHLSGDTSRPGPVLEAELADISKTGAGVVAGQPLPVGQKLVAVVHLPERDHPFTQVCTVVNCREVVPGRFRAGMRFGAARKGLLASLFGR